MIYENYIDQSRLFSNIAKFKSDPKNVPVFSENGNYYVLGRDLELYMESALIEDATVAMNNIATSLLYEGASVTPENLIVLGYMGECTVDRLNESGVLLELKVGEQDVNKLGSQISALSKTIVNKIKKLDSPSSSAHKSEAARLKKIKEDAKDELKEMKQNNTKFVGNRIMLFFTKYFKFVLKMLPAHIFFKEVTKTAGLGVLKAGINTLFTNSAAELAKAKALGILGSVTGIATAITAITGIVGGAVSGFNASINYEKYLNDYIDRLDELIKYHEDKAKALEKAGK